MTRTVSKLAGMAAVAALMAGPAAAQAAFVIEPDFSRSIVDRKIDVNDFVDLRASAEVIAIEDRSRSSDRAIETQLEFENLGTFIDVRPFRNSFVISGGVYSGDRTRIDSASRIDSGDRGLAPEPAGALKLAVQGETVAPFVGFGYDTTFDSDRRLGVKVMAGALFSGTPEVAMTSREGPYSGDAMLRTQLDQDRQAFEEQTTNNVFPVVQVGLTYRF